MGEHPMIYAIASLQYCTGVGKEPAVASPAPRPSTGFR